MRASFEENAAPRADGSPAQTCWVSRAERQIIGRPQSAVNDKILIARSGELHERAKLQEFA